MGELAIACEAMRWLLHGAEAHGIYAENVSEIRLFKPAGYAWWSVEADTTMELAMPATRW